ncbi:hypothetical protein T12_9988 [Trichinella patagoniensis]|uniref:Uncharacterized protein n=1 Tax=Trichinella patagoniensis TaxID=990121 RepID=A0A0V1AE68_9BILA|nr:hypothetical protein T12_9988 [Trichinella patagoniensis]
MFIHRATDNHHKISRHDRPQTKSNTPSTTATFLRITVYCHRSSGPNVPATVDERNRVVVIRSARSFFRSRTDFLPDPPYVFPLFRR